MSVSSLPLEPEPEGRARPLPSFDTWPDYAQHCSLAAVDIADFSRPDRDDEVQLHLRRSLYEIVGAAFHDIAIDWDGPGDLHREDRGDGIAIVCMPHIPTGLLVTELPDPLLARLRHYNKMSSPAAQIQLRLALHAGLVTRDAHGFAGQAAIHLFRILDAPPVKRELAESSADLALITSDYVYGNFVSNSPGPVDPDAYTQVKVNVKHTHDCAWFRLAGRATPGRTRPASGQVVRSASRPSQRGLASTG